MSDVQKVAKELNLTRLKSIREKSEVSELISLLDHPDKEVRWSVAEALGEIGAIKAVPKLIELSEEEKNKFHYCKALVKIGTVEGLTQVIKLVESSPDANYYPLKFFKNKEHLPIIIELWNKGNWKVNYDALLQAFAENNITETVPIIVKTYEDVRTNEEWKDTQKYRTLRLLLEALGKLGDSRALQFLKQQLDKDTLGGPRKFLQEAIDEINKKTR